MTSLARKLSFSGDEDEIGAELIKSGGGQELGAPTMDLGKNVKKIHIPIKSCKTQRVCVFSDRAQVERLVELTVEDHVHGDQEGKGKEKEQEGEVKGDSQHQAQGTAGEKAGTVAGEAKESHQNHQ